ncbi:sensor histidine kinase [Kocuria coralli]|uniref:histidine kinase n=1 Tax=Kocuria coralli TaxID=1461025 RepID=A0A5J5L432_9MICC|nr:sensor histidine kinase [Kocuria coralli]KAA9395721.1 sensor histidine kinase [Kocuria coralli]
MDAPANVARVSNKAEFLQDSAAAELASPGDAGTARRRRWLPEGGLAVALGDASAPDWTRPAPNAAGYRRDALGAVVLTLVGLLSLALTESYAGVTDGAQRWWGYAIVGAVTIPLTWRRKHPVVVLIFTTVAFIGSAYINMMAIAQLSTQVAYFASVYAAVAWSRSREVAAIVVVMLALVIGTWLVIDLTISSSYSEYVEQLGNGTGPFDAVTAYAVYSILVHLAFFGGAVFAGRASWRSALRQDQIQEQADTIASQSQQLARRAVIEERLRIARELHDVVAHHVSAIGVQAGAARKILTRDTGLAEEALRTVEESSRQAVTETRQLLGVLREEGQEPSAFGTDGVGDLQRLVQDYADRGLSVTLGLAVDDDVDLARLPPALGLSVYRCVQESLANVLRHSTGRDVSVVLRTVDEHAFKILELEVLDRGRPREDTSGTGFGLIGLKERAQLHGGTCETGPRTPGPGWRVRSRFPLLDYGDAPGAAEDTAVPAARQHVPGASGVEGS